MGRHAKEPPEIPPQRFKIRLVATSVIVVVCVSAGFLIALANNGFSGGTSHHGSSVPPSASSPAPTPIPEPTHSRNSAQRNHARPLGLPLKISEAPIDPGGNMTWMFPWKFKLSRSQLNKINYLLLTGQFDSLYDYLYGLGGYLHSADTSFMITNRRSYPIWVRSIKAVNVKCSPPLAGTLISASDGSNDAPLRQLVIVPHSSNKSAMLVPAADPADLYSPYFQHHPVRIDPGETKVFNIRGIVSDAACTFWDEITVVDDGQPVTQRLMEEPFRVSDFPRAYIRAEAGPGPHRMRGYQSLYIRGSAGPGHSGGTLHAYPSS